MKLLSYYATALLQIHGITLEAAARHFGEHTEKWVLALYIFTIKIYGCLKLALPLSILGLLSNDIFAWGVGNYNYIMGVMGCIAVDHIIGTIYHLRQRDFTLKRNAVGLVTKIGLCAGAALMFEIIQHAMRDAPLVYEYLKMVTRLIVLLYPAGSAFMNMSALTNGVFPPIGWIKKIKAFNSDLDLDRFKPKE